MPAQEDVLEPLAAVRCRLPAPPDRLIGAVHHDDRQRLRVLRHLKEGVEMVAVKGLPFGESARCCCRFRGAAPGPADREASCAWIMSGSGLFACWAFCHGFAAMPAAANNGANRYFKEFKAVVPFLLVWDEPPSLARMPKFSIRQLNAMSSSTSPMNTRGVDACGRPLGDRSGIEAAYYPAIDREMRSKARFCPAFFQSHCRDACRRRRHLLWQGPDASRAAVAQRGFGIAEERHC